LMEWEENSVMTFIQCRSGGEKARRRCDHMMEQSKSISDDAASLINRPL